MYRSLVVAFAALLLGALSPSAAGRAQETAAFSGELILIGVKAKGESHACEIRTLPLDGGEGRSLFRKKGVDFGPGGRLFRGRLAFCILPGDETDDDGLWVLESSGEARKFADGFGMIMAWSPEGDRVAAYRSADDDEYESFVVDVAAGETTILELPDQYLIEDWRASDGVRCAMFLNYRNQLYRETKGDSYPTRQLDLMTPDGKLTPLTKNPSTDNIWSRFSPKGDRVAHYSRRLVGEKSLEHAAVCEGDGDAWKEIFCFTTYGDERGLSWFRPARPPAWAPNGSALAWLIHSNEKPEASNERPEILLLPLDGKDPKRIDLKEAGIESVSAIEWR